VTRKVIGEGLRWVLVLFLVGTALAKAVAFARGEFAHLDPAPMTAVLGAAIGEFALAILLAFSRTAEWAAWLAAFAFLGAGTATLVGGQLGAMVIRCQCLGVLPIHQGLRFIIQGAVIVLAVCLVALRIGSTGREAAESPSG
jgi:hypothetical protein